MRTSRQILALAAASLFGATAQLHAQVIDFHGGVIGCFVATSTPVTPCPFAGPASFSAADVSGGGTLTYTSGTFVGPTSGSSFFNNVGFGNALATPGSTGDFGNLVITGDYNRLPGQEYLELTFIFDNSYTSDGGGSPPGTPHVTPDPFTTSVSLIGSVVAGNGGASVSFLPFVQGIPALDGGTAFAFSGGNDSPGCRGINPVCVVPVSGGYSGEARVVAATTSVGSGGQPAAIQGNILVLSTTPEPATVALFATGLVGLIPVARRRAKNRA